MLRAGELDRSDFDDAWAAWIDPIAEDNAKTYQPHTTPSVSAHEKALQRPSATPSHTTPAKPEPYEPLLRALLAVASTLAFTAWLNNHNDPLSDGSWPLLISLPFGLLGLSGAILASSPRPFLLYGISSLAIAYWLAQNLASLLPLPFSHTWLAILVLFTVFWLSIRCVTLFSNQTRSSTAFQWRSSEWTFSILILGLAMQAALAPIPANFNNQNLFSPDNIRNVSCHWLPLALILFADSILTFGRPPRADISLPRWALRITCLTAAWWWALASFSLNPSTYSHHLSSIYLAIASTLPTMALTWMDHIVRLPLTRPEGNPRVPCIAPQTAPHS